MTDYIVLIIGDDARWWDKMTEQERADGMAAHERFSTSLVERGHVITGGAELHRTSEARSIRIGADTVTEGPFAESTEQVGGFYQVSSDDLDDLLECCKILSETGDGIEVRRTVVHAEQPA
ncbi:MAG: YciI family protein [Nocardioides sp.]|uniref:YciI family protein n=1 Tax=Nocardioides sp. TaxID=35761 RepID=UPI0032648716